MAHIDFDGCAPDASRALALDGAPEEAELVAPEVVTLGRAPEAAHARYDALATSQMPLPDGSTHARNWPEYRIVIERNTPLGRVPLRDIRGEEAPTFQSLVEILKRRYVATEDAEYTYAVRDAVSNRWLARGRIRVAGDLAWQAKQGTPLGSLGACEFWEAASAGEDDGVCGQPGRLISEKLGLYTRRRYVCPKHGLASALVAQETCFIHEDCRSNRDLAKRCLETQLRTLCGVGE